MLASYDFKINYVKGTENGRADALSRRPDYIIKDPLMVSILEWEDETLVYKRLRNELIIIDD